MKHPWWHWFFQYLAKVRMYDQTVYEWHRCYYPKCRWEKVINYTIED